MLGRNAAMVSTRTVMDGRVRMALLEFIVFVGFLLPWPSQGHAMHVEYLETQTVSLDECAPDELRSWNATTYDIGNIDEVITRCGNYDTCKDEDGHFPEMKLCFWYDPARKTELCHRIVDSGPGYPCDTTRSLKVLSLCDIKGCANTCGLLLDAEDQSPGAGWVGSLSCWVYEPKLHDFVNILPPVLFSDQGEYKIFRNLGNGIHGVIVKANELADWAKEGRYGRHRYLISVYMQNAKGYCKKIGDFRTAIKYPSLDEDEVDVIIPELDKVKHLILSKQKRHK